MYWHHSRPSWLRPVRHRCDACRQCKLIGLCPMCEQMCFKLFKDLNTAHWTVVWCLASRFCCPISYFKGSVVPSLLL